MICRVLIPTAFAVLVLLCPSNWAAEPSAGKQVDMKFKTSDGATVEYLLHLPSNYTDDGDKLPMMLFLHGRGESNGPISLVAKWGPPRFAARGEDFPFVLVSPQCPKDEHWEDDRQQKHVTELVDQIMESYNIDHSRMYLTGLSMGGYGSWKMAAEQPKRFAAVAPICGKGDPSNGEKLKDIPIWAFHGDQDTAVPYKHSVEMVTAIKAAGGEKIRFTSMEHIGHNCWSPAYATPALYSWMLQHTTGQE